REIPKLRDPGRFFLGVAQFFSVRGSNFRTRFSPPRTLFSPCASALTLTLKRFSGRAKIRDPGIPRSNENRCEPVPCEPGPCALRNGARSEEHTSELQSLAYLVCRLLLEKKKKKTTKQHSLT